MNLNKRGIRFYFEGYDKHFAVVFKNVALEKYALYVANSEIIYYDKKTRRAENGVVETRVYSGEDFLEKTSLFDYHVIQIKILATFKEKTINPSEISNYETFCSSDCEMALICADCYVDIYVKNQELLDVLAKNCKEHYESNVSFITNENDERTGFYVG